MISYITHRLLQAIPVMFLASIPVFLILSLAPGDQALILAGEDASPDDIEEIRQQLGLDRPMIVQYVHWLGRVIHGDLGISYFNQGHEVLDLILQRIPASAELAVAALLIAVVTSIPLGILAAVRRGKLFDNVIVGASTVSIAIPNFWLAILMLLLFSVQLGWLPSGGRPVGFFEDPLQSLRHLILPAFTLSLFSSAVLIRFVRASMIEVLQQDYIRTARSKGMPSRRVLYKHALRNALIPAITVLGVQLGNLLAGALILEQVFAWPGLGQLVLTAIASRDYQLVQGCMLFFVVIFVVTNLLTDIVYGFVDPRIDVMGRN